jgi:hypothetical protein
MLALIAEEENEAAESSKVNPLEMVDSATLAHFARVSRSQFRRHDHLVLPESNISSDCNETHLRNRQGLRLTVMPIDNKSLQRSCLSAWASQPEFVFNFLSPPNLDLQIMTFGGPRM